MQQNAQMLSANSLKSWGNRGNGKTKLKLSEALWLTELIVAFLRHLSIANFIKMATTIMLILQN
jgi:hypothetical protein